MPSGGVLPTKENLTDWFEAGVSCVGLGSQLISKEVIANKDFQIITAKVKDAIEITASLS